ncbi:MAG: RNA polymerase sigma factor SigJ, partial [Holophagales bacterium]|nr:RNA polymerase sigma factor SigJ [Holophagales bacterium]
MQDEKANLFEQHRGTLEGIAYRMLGTLDEARDVVQDTYLKLEEAELGRLQNPRAWLITVCSRLALNQLRSARARRELYVGEWLPEPFPERSHADPGSRAELDETISVALLIALEKLTPDERVAFLLHDIFDLSFDEVAAALDRTSASCRQLASRARRRLRDEKPRFRSSPEEHRRLLEGFFGAAREGDLQRFSSLLADRVELYSDGGGKVAALPKVLRGADAVAAFLVAVFDDYRRKKTPVRAISQWLNGSPGLLILEDGVPVTA